VPTLFVIRGEDQGSRFELTGERVTLGRDPPTRFGFGTQRCPVGMRKFAEMAKTTGWSILAVRTELLLTDEGSPSIA
jgi:hypothetical protein